MATFLSVRSSSSTFKISGTKSDLFFFISYTLSVSSPSN
jgi:hypothetical protein